MTRDTGLQTLITTNQLSRIHCVWISFFKPDRVQGLRENLAILALWLFSCLITLMKIVHSSRYVRCVCLWQTETVFTTSLPDDVGKCDLSSRFEAKSF